MVLCHNVSHGVSLCVMMCHNMSHDVALCAVMSHDVSWCVMVCHDVPRALPVGITCSCGDGHRTHVSYIIYHTSPVAVAMDTAVVLEM